MARPPSARSLDTASRWSWRLALTAAALAVGALSVALLGRLTGGERTFAPLPALSIPVIVVLAMAGLLVATSTVRRATRVLEREDTDLVPPGAWDSPESSDVAGTGPVWDAWRRAVRAVMLNGALVLGAPLVLLVAYATL